jgi:hypothetical protein
MSTNYINTESIAINIYNPRLPWYKHIINYIFIRVTCRFYEAKIKLIMGLSDRRVDLLIRYMLVLVIYLTLLLFLCAQL